MFLLKIVLLSIMYRRISLDDTKIKDMYCWIILYFFFHISNVTISRVSRFVILELQVVVYCLPFSSSRLLTYWWHISISIVIRFKYPLIPHSWRAFQMKSHLGKGLDKLIQNVHFKSMKCVLWFHLAPSLQNLSCRPELNIENIKQQVE